MISALRLRRCRHCQRLFYLCRRCDRGQCYCGAECRDQRQLILRRESDASFRNSPEAKLDQRDRQRNYRRRRTSVTGDGSAPPADPPIIGARSFMVTAMLVLIMRALLQESFFNATTMSSRSVYCVCCGAASAWVQRDVQRPKPAP